VRLLTIDEAAEILSVEVGRPVKAWMVEFAIKEGRLRAEKKPGRRGSYLIPEEELRRLVAEMRQAHPQDARGAQGSDAGGPTLTAWDYLAERPLESLWFGDWFGRWRRRGSGRR
jgi:hypothetical protein